MAGPLFFQIPEIDGSVRMIEKSAFTGFLSSRPGGIGLCKWPMIFSGYQARSFQEKRLVV
jgi:hypothetical protein